MSHPLDMFKFCPVCGSSHWAEHNAKSKHCADCGFTYYANPLSATAAFILRAPSGSPKRGEKPSSSPKNEEMEMLVVRRAKEPAKGTLDLPGGFVDMDETGEQGIIREIQEETGLSVTAVDYLFSIPNHYVYSGMELHTLDMFYCVYVGPDAEAFAADDAAECQWLPLSSVHAEDFGLHSISQGVRRFIAKML